MRMMIILESDAGILGKKKSECSYQESNLRPSECSRKDNALQTPESHLFYRIQYSTISDSNYYNNNNNLPNK